MKKLTAMILALVMVLALTAGAFAAGRVSMEEAKQIALNKAGVKASEATFTKAHRDYDDGREEYELEFFVNNTEFEIDVDANTGRVVKFDVERYGRDYCDFDDRYDFDDWYDFD